MEPLVYLAGPIAGMQYGNSTSWREYVARSLTNYHIQTLSPLRGKTYLKDEVHIQDSYEDQVLSSRRGLTTRDRMDVMRCDMVLINFDGADRVSIGTCIEVGWADAWRKPMVIVMDEKNLHYHAMIRECAGFIVPTLDDAIKVVRHVLLPDIVYEAPENIAGPITLGAPRSYLP